MKKSIVLILLFLVCSFPFVRSQDFSRNYTPITSSGSLPNDFTESASIKAKNEIAELNKKGDNKSKEKARFIISNTFFLDNVIKSGKILYGDPISVYVGKIADEILKNDPETRAKIRLYVVKTPVVNAYSFDNGVILINTGLISQLKNESQLAFIICHEIAHFLKKHSITAHIEFLGMEKKKRSFNKNGTNLLLEKSRFNKSQESEADDEGFNMYSQTGFSYQAIESVFDVLQYSYLPFDNIEFDKKHFNDQDMVVPESYYLSKVKDIHTEDNYNDSLSTHPNIRKRKEAIDEKIAGKDNSGRKTFLISESDFYNIRELARFEECRLYMQELDYPKAIYCSYALLKKYPQNVYLKRIISRSLYEVAIYKSMYVRYEYVQHTKDNVASYYKKKMRSKPELLTEYADSVQGNSQQVYSLLKTLSPLELSLLALHSNWKLYQEEGYTNEYTRDVCDSLMLMLCYKHRLKLEKLSKDKRPTPADATALKPTAAAKGGTLSADNFCRYAFVDILNNKQFVEMYTNAAKRAKKIKAEPKSAVKKTKKAPKAPVKTKKTDGKDNGKNEDEDGSPDPYAIDSVKIDASEIIRINSEYSKKRYKLKEYKTLGIDKIVIMDPFYMKLDERKKDGIQYFSGEEGLANFTRLLQENAQLMKLDYELLGPSTFEAGDINKYNDFSVINDWIVERVTHGDFDKAMILNREFRTYLQQQYNTKYFLWTGAISIQKKKQIVRLVIGSILFPYLLPLTANALLFPKYSTYYYSILFDIETGKMVLYSDHEIEMKDSRGLLNSMIYDTFFQIKTAPPVSSTTKK